MCSGRLKYQQKDIKRRQRLCQRRKFCYAPGAAVVVANRNFEIFKMDGITCHVINIEV